MTTRTLSSTLVIGSGFLGKYLIASLLENPANKVIVVDRANPDSLWSFPKLRQYQNSPNLTYRWQSSADAMQLFEGDEWMAVQEGHKGYQREWYDNIVYTAAIADVPYAIRSPIDTYQVNVMNTVQFFEFLRMIDYDGKVIMMSSESTYGHQPEDKLPIKEDALPMPVSVYGSSKLAQEQVALAYHRAYGIKSVILKSGTMFGQYSRTKQMIPIFLRQIMEDKPVTLEGDGSTTRDLVYVENTVDAIQKAMETDGIEGEIINIGSGSETTLFQLIQGMKAMLGKPTAATLNGIAQDGFVPIQYKPFRAGEQGLRVWLDITKAKEKLGWTPKVTLHDGLRHTAEWIGEVVGFTMEERTILHQMLWLHKYAITGQKVGETLQVEEK
jgi:nucleoside-diphosphate-sugar epimerase